MTTKLLHKHLEQIQSTDDLEKNPYCCIQQNQYIKASSGLLCWTKFYHHGIPTLWKKIWLSSASVGLTPNICLLFHMWIILGMGCIISTPWNPCHQKSNIISYKGSTLCGMQLVQQTQPGACPTNGISIEFEIRAKIGVLLFEISLTDQNNILHTSWQCNCCDV